jgi:hypothetical protein
MKNNKLKIAKLLSQTPNVSASTSEIIQFFRSPQYNPDEQEESNYIEDFMVFRGILDSDLIEADK